MHAITVKKSNCAAKRHEYLLRKIHSKIDHDKKTGKDNENAAEKHYVGCTSDGSRCWSF